MIEAAANAEAPLFTTGSRLLMLVCGGLVTSTAACSTDTSEPLEVTRRVPTLTSAPDAVAPPDDIAPDAGPDTGAPSDTDTSSEPTLAETLAALCAAGGLVTQTCRVHVGCRAGSTFEELTACEDHLRATCEATLSDLAERIESGRLAFSTVGLERCQSALSALACGTPAAMQAALGDACDAVFFGRLERGEICEDAGDCAPGLGCVTADGTCPGRCQPPRALGESCQPDLEPCQASLSCEAGRCVPAHVLLGEACVTTNQCPQGSRCLILDDAEGAQSAGVCARKAPLEADCEDDEDCASGFCAFELETLMGDELALELGRCKTPLMKGEVCEPLVGGCGPGLVCDGASSRCDSLGELGEACIEGESACLGSDLVCLEGRCELAPTLFDPCDPTLPGHCGFGFCAADGLTATCRPFLAPGAACQDEAQCGALSCLDGVCAAPSHCHATASDINVGRRFRLR